MLHGLSLLVVVQSVTVIYINFQRTKLGHRNKTQHSPEDRAVHYCKHMWQRVKTVDKNALSGTTGQFTKT